MKILFVVLVVLSGANEQKDVRAVLRDLRTELKVGPVHPVFVSMGVDPCPENGDFALRSGCYFKFFEHSSTPLLIITTPGHWIGGAALGLCSLDKPTWVTSGRTRVMRRNMIKHELGHMLGARHSRSGVMKPWVPMSGRYEKFTRANRSEVKACLQNPSSPV